MYACYDVIMYVCMYVCMYVYMYGLGGSGCRVRGVPAGRRRPARPWTATPLNPSTLNPTVSGVRGHRVEGFGSWGLYVGM
jgi:hypothetical protein